MDVGKKLGKKKIKNFFSGKMQLYSTPLNFLQLGLIEVCGIMLYTLWQGKSQNGVKKELIDNEDLQQKS